MANILVTGGAGFSGGNFVHYWTQQHPDDALIVLDALTYAGNRSTIADAAQAQLVEGDIRDTDLVEKLLRALSGWTRGWARLCVGILRMKAGGSRFSSGSAAQPEL